MRRSAVPTDAEIAALAATIADVGREMARSVPPPRGASFFGLDMRPEDPSVLDAFCQQGIFRKYERAVMLGAGLGGAARWWAVRFGCWVVGIDPSPAVVAAAGALSRRAGLAARTQFQAGQAGRLPLRDGCFTHAWVVPALSEHEDPAGVLHETFRVLRPGGALAARLDEPSAAGIECVRAAGFVRVRTERFAEVDPSPLFTAARQRLERRIRERLAAPRASRLVAWSEDAGARGGSAVQLFAQRPS